GDERRAALRGRARPRPQPRRPAGARAVSAQAPGALGPEGSADRRVERNSGNRGRGRGGPPSRRRAVKEIREILTALAALRARGEPAALATIIRVAGSTYRRAGARLLIRQDETTVGSISGGCLEGDVAEAAREVLRTGRARMMTYDLTADDDAVWGLGLGCNGKIEVFVEAVRPDAEPDVAALLQACIDDRRFAALATVIASPSERGRP